MLCDHEPLLLLLIPLLLLLLITSSSIVNYKRQKEELESGFSHLPLLPERPWKGGSPFRQREQHECRHRGRRIMKTPSLSVSNPSSHTGNWAVCVPCCPRSSVLSTSTIRIVEGTLATLKAEEGGAFVLDNGKQMFFLPSEVYVKAGEREGRHGLPALKVLRIKKRLGKV